MATAADRPPVAFLFAPGAGVPSSSEWMTGWARRLATLGPVVRFDYPYQQAGRRRPDPLPVLVEAHREALRAFRTTHPGHTVVLAGKSMGSRVGCHLSLEEPDVVGLVCFGYPLVGVARGTRPVRDEVLRALVVPVLFVQGSRDDLCPLDHLERVRLQMQARSVLHVVETGDHSLQTTQAHTRATGRTQEVEDASALAAVGTFVATLPGGAS